MLESSAAGRTLLVERSAPRKSLAFTEGETVQEATSGLQFSSLVVASDSASRQVQSYLAMLSPCKVESSYSCFAGFRASTSDYLIKCRALRGASLGQRSSALMRH